MPAPCSFLGAIRKIKGAVVDIIKPVLDIEREFIEFVKPHDTLEQAQNSLDISCSIIFWDERQL